MAQTGSFQDGRKGFRVRENPDTKTHLELVSHAYISTNAQEGEN